MQMAQRKRQHEREEASEQEGEDEEYSEEEEEEYFEEGEEEERSFDPKEEASESDDSRDWKRRSRYKRESFRRPRQARKAKRQPVAASPRRSESREPSAKRHQPLAVRKPKAVLRPQPPKYPPPPPPPPPPYTPGFWFGHTHRMDITGPAVAGRWIHAKNQVWQEGEWSRPLPKLFRAGGHLSRFRQQAWDEDMQRCLAINGLLKYHEFEHRRWIPEWGPKQPPEPAVGGSENWQVINEPAPAADHPFFRTVPVAAAGRMAPCNQPLAVAGRTAPCTSLNDRAGGGGPADVEGLRSEGCLCC